MNKIILLLLLTLNLFSAAQNFPPPPPPPPAPKAGAQVTEDPIKLSLALIDKLQNIFDEAAVSSTAAWGKIVKSLEGLMREAREARDAVRLDEPFFKRYSRLIRVMKMAMMEDPEQILQPVLLKEMGAFVQDILGQSDPNFDTEMNIGKFSDACATEMTRLRLELSSPDRSKTRQKR